MSWREDFISMMRSEGEVNNPSSIQLAVMASPNSLMIGGMTITSESLLFNDKLIKPVATAVAGQCPSGGGSLTDKSTYISALQMGDMVAVQKVEDKTNGTTKYLILERMVSV